MQPNKNVRNEMVMDHSISQAKQFQADNFNKKLTRFQSTPHLEYLKRIMYRSRRFFSSRYTSACGQHKKKHRISTRSDILHKFLNKTSGQLGVKKVKRPIIWNGGSSNQPRSNSTFFLKKKNELNQACWQR